MLAESGESLQSRFLNESVDGAVTRKVLCGHAGQRLGGARRRFLSRLRKHVRVAVAFPPAWHKSTVSTSTVWCACVRVSCIFGVCLMFFCERERIVCVHAHDNCCTMCVVCNFLCVRCVPKKILSK